MAPSSRSPLPSPRRSRRRKAVALMEVVSYGTPQKLFAAAGQCHRVSLNPKPSHQLQARQVGVQRTLACNANVSSSDIPLNLDPGALAFLQELVKTAVTEAVQDETEKLRKKILAKLRNDLGVTVRSLVSEWAKSPFGRQSLETLSETLNEAYMAKGIHRRVLKGDAVKEIKHLVRGHEAEDAQSAAAETLLKVVKEAVEDSLKMPGDEFVTLLASYVHTNQHVHVDWSQQSLQEVVDDAKAGKLQVGGETRTTWINRMALDLANANGWQLNV